MKKNFSTCDIAKQFISPEAAEAPQEQQGATPAEAGTGFVYRKEIRETKSVRLQLVLKPSTAEKLRKAAAMSDTSMNDIMGQMIDNYL